MPISLKCPGCSHAYQLPDTAAGKKAACRKCGATFIVEEALSALSGVAELWEEEFGDDIDAGKPPKVMGHALGTPADFSLAGGSVENVEERLRFEIQEVDRELEAIRKVTNVTQQHLQGAQREAGKVNLKLMLLNILDIFNPLTIIRNFLIYFSGEIPHQIGVEVSKADRQVLDEAADRSRLHDKWLREAVSLKRRRQALELVGSRHWAAHAMMFSGDLLAVEIALLALGLMCWAVSFWSTAVSLVILLAGVAVVCWVWASLLGPLDDAVRRFPIFGPQPFLIGHRSIYIALSVCVGLPVVALPMLGVLHNWLAR